MLPDLFSKTYFGGRVKLPVLVGVALLCAGCVQEFFFGNPPKPREMSALPWVAGTMSTTSPNPVGELLTDEPGSQLYSGSVAAPSGEAASLNLDEFIGMLEQRVPKPIAKKVVKEFNADPKLKDSWQIYQQLRGGKAPAKNFVDFITRIPAFRQLMARFQGEPGFKQAFNDAVKQPQISQVVRAGMKSLSGGAQSAGGAGRIGSASPANIEAIKREWEKKALSGVDLSSSRAGAIAGRGAGAAAGPAVSAANPASMGGAGGTPATGGGPQGAASNLNAHDVAKNLDKNWMGSGNAKTNKSNVTDNSSWAVHDWRQLMLQNLSQSEAQKMSAAMCTMGEGVKQVDGTICNRTPESVWGACWSTGIFKKCKDMCTGANPIVPNCPADLASNSYLACRSENVRDPKECTLACLDDTKKYGCTDANVDRTEWDDLCTKKQVGKQYCLTSQHYGETCVQVGTACIWDTGERPGGGGPAAAASGVAGLDRPLTDAEKGCIEDFTSNPNCQDILTALAATIDGASPSPTPTTTPTPAGTALVCIPMGPPGPGEKVCPELSPGGSCPTCPVAPPTGPTTVQGPGFFERAGRFIGGTAAFTLPGIGFLLHGPAEDLGGAVGKALDNLCPNPHFLGC